MTSDSAGQIFSRRSCLYFFAEWDESEDGAGAQMKTVFEALSSRFGKNISFVKVEAESAPSVSSRFAVTVVPTFVCLLDEAVVGRVEGANPPELTKIVNNLNKMPLPALSTSESSQPKKDEQPVLTKALEGRLKRMLGASPSLLFMKGSPDAPRSFHHLFPPLPFLHSHSALISHLIVCHSFSSIFFLDLPGVDSVERSWKL